MEQLLLGDLGCGLCDFGGLANRALVPCGPTASDRDQAIDNNTGICDGGAVGGIVCYFTAFGLYFSLMTMYDMMYDVSQCTRNTVES